MKWLRQHNKVETLSAEAEHCAVQMNHLHEQLGQRVHARLRQPGTMAWAFSAGILYGGSQTRKQNDQKQTDRAFALLRYLNSIAIILNLMTQFNAEQQQV